MKTISILILSCLLPLTSLANDPEPTSTLPYQQTINTRIVVEENFLRFFTGGSECMTIDANGNVGVGINQPTNPLSLKSLNLGQDLINAFNSDNNEIFELGTLSDNETYMVINDKNGNPGLEYRSDLDLFFVLGKVGIGTSSPSEKLDINTSPTVGESLRMSKGNLGTTVLLGDGGSQVAHGILRLFADGNENVRLYSGGNSWFMNNVGIGTNNPTNKLHISLEPDVYDGIKLYSGGQNDTGGTGVFIHNWYGGTGGLVGLDNGAQNNLATNALNLYSIWSPLVFSTGYQGTPSERMRIHQNGNVGIGTAFPGYKLHVNGDAKANRFISNTTTYADFVFEDDYRLTPLSEVEEYIEKNNHLPDIPSESEARANGVDLQKMQAKLLQKIEELTLYVIEQNKKMIEQQEIMNSLRMENENLSKRTQKLELQIRK